MWVSSNLFRGWKEQQDKSMVNMLSLLDLQYLPSILRHQCSWPWSLPPYTSTYNHQLPWFLDLDWTKLHHQFPLFSNLQKSRLWDFSVPQNHVTIPIINHYMSIYWYIDLSIDGLIEGFFPLKNPDWEEIGERERGGGKKERKKKPCYLICRKDDFLDIFLQGLVLEFGCKKE